jgi:glutamine synthetase
MTIAVETKLMLNIARTMVFPAAIRYQGELATSLTGLQEVGIETDADTLTYVTQLIANLQGAIKGLAEVAEAPHSSPEAGCNHCRDATIPAMEALRAVVDELEGVVADEHWPLPTYQEMLFIR